MERGDGVNLFGDTGGLRITDDFFLPPDADARRVSVLGMSGSGKTSAAKLVVERLAAAGRRVCVIDPAGVWWGLKTSADGAGAGLPFVVFGGRRGDVPLEAGAGAAVADVVMGDGEPPVVLDLSGFEAEEDLSRCAADFLRRLAFLQNPDREPLLVVVDEADLVAPQNARGAQVDSQRQLIRVARRSRSDGLGLLTVTQRPAAIHKDVLAQAEAVLLMRFGGYNDLATVEQWIGSYLSRAERDEVVSALPALDDGECFLTSPSWIKTFRRLRLPLPATFDSSATPRAGERRVASVRADVDLAALAERFAAAFEREREADPALLRRRVEELTRQLAARPVEGTGPRTVIQYVDVPVLREGEAERLATLASDMIGMGKGLLAGGQEIQNVLFAARPLVPLESPPLVVKGEDGPLQPADVSEADAVEGTGGRTPDEGPPAGAVGRNLPRPKADILDVLAGLERLGLAAPRREQVAVFAGQSPRSSGFGAHLTALRTEGRVEYPEPGRLSLTDRGREQARRPDAPLTRQALQAAWLARLPEAQGRLLRPIIAVHPDSLSRPDLAALAQVSERSSAYGAALTDLRELGLASYPSPGRVAATALLFPEGLP